MSNVPDCIVDILFIEKAEKVRVPAGHPAGGRFAVSDPLFGHPILPETKAIMPNEHTMLKTSLKDNKTLRELWAKLRSANQGLAADDGSDSAGIVQQIDGITGYEAPIDNAPSSE